MSVQIRDSIHGSIPIEPCELRLIDHPAFQRLRNIRQLGFADLAFPGATHSRYSHSLGAMHLATRIFDHVFSQIEVEIQERARMRQALRLAVLLHDLGHTPLSHSLESRLSSGNNHEDITRQLIQNSSFSLCLRKEFECAEIGPDEIISLDFKIGGIDFQPILQQMVSSECDADRMDYLQRDSFYCGVNYGKFDADWLISNLVPVYQENQVYLGIRSKALYSFEDFLLSRYHMFASVYLHHTPVIFEKMLVRYFEDCPDEFVIPVDLEKFIQIDDTDVWMHLKSSQNVWAERIVQRKPYRLISDERTPEEHQAICHQLASQSIDFIASESKNAISKYFEGSSQPLYVQTKRGDLVPLNQYSELYQRYQKPVHFNRIYVAPKDQERAQSINQAF
ncbi:MAG: HD domain-containing protein [Myxococcaceae bacterium]|nr:HD domain-containing protein [Myxococcaceae bacterium]MBH2006361.1 HD domain-containing protein [Myxococcaceae bacterium]